MAQSLHVDINLRDRHAQHFLDAKLHYAHHIMSDLRDAQPIFQYDKYIQDDLVVGNTHLHARVELFLPQQDGLPMMQARRGNADNAIALADRPHSQRVDRAGQHLYLSQWMRSTGPAL